MSFFSAPDFLSMPAVGLDISADAIRFIELEKKKGELTVTRFANRNFPLGIFSEGRVKDKKRMQDVVATLAREYKLTFANIALPEEQAYLANMRIPKVEGSEIRSAIELHLEEHVPISAGDAIFDYIIIEDGGNKRRDTIDVVVSVLPRAEVEAFLEVFHGTGITPKAFEFESQAMARAIVPHNDKGTFLVVDIGKVVTDVFVTANGAVQFSASLDIGGHNLTQAIEKALHVDYEEAEELKITHGLLGGAKQEALHEALQVVMSDLRTRLMRHYSYWQTHHGDKVGGNIETIYLTGGGANLRGVAEYIGMAVDVKVKIANPWINVASFERYIPPLPLHVAHAYTAAIGLALRNTFSA